VEVITDFFDRFVNEGKDYNSHFDFVHEFLGCFEDFFFERGANVNRLDREDKGMRFVYDEFIFKLVVVARAAYCAVIAELG
jgi:hypothetical protein